MSKHDKYFNEWGNEKNANVNLWLGFPNGTIRVLDAPRTTLIKNLLKIFAPTHIQSAYHEIVYTDDPGPFLAFLDAISQLKGLTDKQSICPSCLAIHEEKVGNSNVPRAQCEDCGFNDQQRVTLQSKRMKLEDGRFKHRCFNESGEYGIVRKHSRLEGGNND